MVSSFSLLFILPIWELPKRKIVWICVAKVSNVFMCYFLYIFLMYSICRSTETVSSGWCRKQANSFPFL